MDGTVSVQGKKRGFGLTGSELKYIAILAMLCDHIAYMFLPPESLLFGVLRFFGRTTGPIMCFFITEGFHHTHNLKKYFLRLGIFAVISHFAINYAFNGGFLTFGTESVIANLFLSLLSVCIYNVEKVKPAFKLPLILFLLYLSTGCDWGMEAILFTLAFEFARGKRTNQALAFFLVAFVRILLPLLRTALKYPDIFLLNWYKLGLIIPALLILVYNGERGGGKHTKWVFYIFYPAHLLFLGYLYYRVS